MFKREQAKCVSVFFDFLAPKVHQEKVSSNRLKRFEDLEKKKPNPS